MRPREIVRKEPFPLSSVPCCTYTRASFLVERLARLAFKPDSLSRKNQCQFLSSKTSSSVRGFKVVNVADVTSEIRPDMLYFETCNFTLNIFQGFVFTYFKQEQQCLWNYKRLHHFFFRG